MTGVSSNNPQFNDPSFLANNNPQQAIDHNKPPTDIPRTIVGGDMVSVFKQEETLKRLGIDLGLSTDLNSSHPFLQLPDTAPFSLNLDMLSHLINSMSVSDSSTTSTDDSFGFNAGGGDDLGSLSSALPTDMASTDKSTVLKALLSFTGVPNDKGLSADQKTAFTNVLDEMATKIAGENAIKPSALLTSGDAGQISIYLNNMITPNGMSPGDALLLKASLDTAASSLSANEFTQGLSSGDPTVVLGSLKSFIDIKNNPALTDEQKTTLDTKLNELATNIATENASGKPNPILSTLDGNQLATFLLSKVDVSSLPAADKLAFTASVNSAASDISSINAASNKAPVPSALMTGMQSTDESAVLDSMKTMLKGQNLTDAEITALTPKLTELAATIAQKNAAGGSGLDITDGDTLKLALLTLLGSGNDVADATLQKAIGALAIAFAAENTVFYIAQSKSTDANVVFNALRILSNIDHNTALTPQERQVALSYLSLMAQALAFMSTVRAKVSMLEAELRKAENQGKLATILDQTRAAENAFKNGISKIGKDYQKALDAIAMKELMAILGPIIIVILAIITAILSIVGCSAVGAALMIMVIVVMAVVAIADMQTGMFEKAGKACSKDPAGQKAAAFGFQAIIMAIMVVVTLGAAAGMIAIQMGQTISKEVIKAALAEVVKQLVESGKKLLQFFIGQVVSLLMSSGLLTEGFIKMFKAMGMSDKDAEIGAMVMTIVIMIIMMAAMLKSATSSVKTAGTAGAKMAKDSVDDGIEIATKSVTFAQGTKAGADDAVDAAITVSKAAGTTALNQAASKAAEEIEEMLTSAIRNLTKKLVETTTLSPTTMLILLQALAALAQVGQGVATAINEFKQADLSTAQANLTKITSDQQALIDLLKQLLPTFDMTQQDLDNDSKDFMKGYTELMNLFANMVSSASAIVTTTSQTS